MRRSPAMNNTEFQLRKLQMRQAELEEAIKVVQSINSGNGKAVAQNNTRGEGQTLSGWNDRLDLGNMIIAGHSLGSNLALQAVKGAPSTAVPANASLNFDPGKDSGPLNTDVTVPLAIIDSEEWSGTPTNFFGQQHFDVVKGIAQNALAKNNKSWFMSLRTSYLFISSIPFIFISTNSKLVRVTC